MRPGDVLAGKYQVERVLGAGGMGVVVAARHVQLGERVAIKFLLPEVAREGGEILERFSREGRVAAKIKSEHVARVIDFGVLGPNDARRDGSTLEGSPYLVMEYLDGKDLADVLADRGPLPVSDTIDYVLQACEAIAEAHALGVVHRDLKPANLFLTRRADRSPCIKVLDFGISKTLRGEEKRMTTTASVFGSPLYMSPEQMSAAKNADARSDIWSLGVILYELLTREVPFDGNSPMELATAVLTSTPKRVVDHRPDVPRELAAVVMRCLARDPKARFSSVGELARALAPFGSEAAKISAGRASMVTTGDEPTEQVQIDLLLARAKPAAMTQPRPVTLTASSLAAARSPQALPIAAGVTLGLLLGVGVVVFAVGGRHKPAPPNVVSAAPQTADVSSAHAAPPAPLPSIDASATAEAPMPSSSASAESTAAPAPSTKRATTRPMTTAKPRASSAPALPDDRL